MRLNLLGINILPVTEYNDFFLATSNEQVSLRIEIAEIACEQPAIFQHGRGRLLPVPVALHHDGTVNRDLADGRAFFLRLWFNDLRFDPGKRWSYRADHIVRRLVGERRASRLGQAIGLQHVNPERIKITRDLGIETRAASDQIPHALAERGMQFAEESPPGVDAYRTQGTIYVHQDSEHRLSCFSALRYFFEDPLMNQIEKLWHHSKSRNLAFLQGAQKFRSVQCFQMNHSRTLHQRQKQVCHLRQHVKERQHTKHGIFRTDFYPCKYSFNFTKQVGVSQHDALRVGSRARCIEKGSDAVRRHIRGSKRLWPGRENRIQISSCGAGALARGA